MVKFSEVNKICFGFLLSFLLFFTCFFAVSLPALAKTNTGDILLYYGNNPCSYSQIGDDGYITDFYYPFYVGVCLVSFSDGNYLCFYCPNDFLASSGDLLGVYRNRVYKNWSGDVVGIDTANFFQFTGYNSSHEIDMDGTVFLFRAMKVGNAVVTGIPSYSIDIPYSHDNYLDFCFLTLEGTLLYRQKAVLDGDISVDLGSLESDIKDIQSSSASTASNTAFILHELQIGGSQDVSVIKTYVFMCFMILSATLFRNVFSQWLRNVVRR